MSKTLEGVLVKKPHQSYSMTRDQLYDFSRCADRKTGPYFFMSNYFYIQHAVKGKLLYDPYDFQDKLIRTYHENRFSVALMPRQTGKALPLDTKIPTPNGWTTMGSIKVGDTVIGKNGKPTTVSFATEIMSDHDCYKITFDNGHEIVADADHLWEVNTNDWRTGKKIVSTLDIIGFIKNKREDKSYYIEINDAIDLPEKELPINPYVLGFWLGDGFKSSARYVQHIDDFEISKSIIEGKGYKVSEPVMDSKNTIRATIYGLYKELRENNILNNKHIPNIYLRASIIQRLELLQGLMDTDGSIDKRNGRCEFYQKDHDIITSFCELLSSLGIKYRISEKEIKNQIYYTVGFSTSRFDMFKYDRKLQYQKKVKNHPKNSRYYIHSIEKVESVPVRCIQVVNEDHMFLCSEQMIPTHNTTSAAGYLLWYAMFIPDSTILIAAHKFSGAQEIMQRIRYAYELCPDFIRAGVVTYNRNSIEFENGSRIVAQATTENTGRGMAITLLYCDEFAFVRQSIAQEFWTSISPTLSTGGKAIVTSTPNSDEDQFSLIWKEANKNIDEFGNERKDGLGKNGFKAFTCHWSEHPERDDKWASEEMSRIGEERFRREHECEFLIFDETLISSTTLVDLEGVDPLFKTAQVRWYKEPEKGHIYLVSLDPAIGTGGDNAAIQVYELPDMKHVAEWMNNKTPIPQQIQTLKTICERLTEATENVNDVYYSVENNTVGEAALVSISELGEENIQGTFLSEPKRSGHVRTYRKGFNTTQKVKLSACAKLKSLIETKRMEIKSKPLISELKGFVAKGGSYEAKDNENDDLVMALILIVRMAQVLQDYNPELQKHLRDHLDAEVEPMPFIVMF